MRNWEINKLGEVCDIGDGNYSSKYPKASEFTASGVPFITATNLKNGVIVPNGIRYISEKQHSELKKGHVQENDLVVVVRGSSTGNSSLVQKQYANSNLNSQLAFLRPKNNLDSRYLYFAFNSPSVQKVVQQTISGSAQPQLPNNKLLGIEIPIPPLSEQKQIVAILDQAFAAIDQAKVNIEKNIVNAKELFDNYLQGVFENPKDNWEKKKWGELCHFVRGPFGGSLKKSMFKEDGYVVYEQKHAIHDHFNQLRYFIDEDKFNEMIRFEVKPGDIIMSCSGVTLGRVAIIPKDIKRGIINQALLKLTPNENVYVHFIKHWLRSNIFQNIIFEYAGGAAIPNVPAAKILKEILIPLPNLEEQIDVVKSIELMLSKKNILIDAYKQKANDLEELKKSILQKAFAGELTEKEIAIP